MATRENTSREQLAREAFALVFSDALQARGLTLDRVHARLVAAGCPVSVATLSYWQSGRSLPTRTVSMAALNELDRIFELPPGYLVSLLPARPDRSWKLKNVLNSFERVQTILESWNTSMNSQLSSIAIHEHHLVRNGGERVISTMRQMMRCNEPGLRSFPYVFQQPEAHIAPRPRPLAGCSIGRSFIDHGEGMAIGEWVFPHELSLGEPVVFDYEVDWVSSDPMDRIFERLMPDQAQLLSISVEFEGAPPSAAWRQHRPSHDAEFTVDEPLPIEGNRFTSLVVDPAHGIHGVRWEP